MWKNTRVSKILGIQYPILQGPFGGNLSSVKLVAAVSALGGLGGYGAYTLTPDEIIQLDKELKAATNKPYNINLWVSDTDATGGIDAVYYENVKALYKPYFDELGIAVPEKPDPAPSKFENQIEVVLKLKPPVFSFIFGIPSATILMECKKRGIVTMGCATTPDEAIALEAAGVDLIVASGFEAGGHRPSFLAPAASSFTGTFVLVQQIKDKVKTPVIAAGGIANGSGVAAAMALGAEGVQIGTAFLACEESNAPAIHKELLFSDQSKYSVITKSFTGRYGRGLRNRITEAAQGQDKNILPFPLQTRFMSSLRKAALEQEKYDMVFFWSGQIAPVLKHKNAADLFGAIVKETNNYFNEKKA